MLHDVKGQKDDEKSNKKSQEPAFSLKKLSQSLEVIHNELGQEQCLPTPGHCRTSKLKNPKHC